MQIIKTQTDKLVVGSNDVAYTAPDTSPTGTAVLNGPVYVGKTGASPNYEAVLNITSNSAQQLPGDQQPACSASLAMKSDGNVVITGDSKTSKALKVNGDTETIGDAHVTGNVSTGGDLSVGGHASWSSSIVATTKLFDIEHPSKGGDHRLAHASLEGPELGVYCRGRTKTNEITLPDYWKDLVDADSITVQIQPIGHPQNIIVKEFDNEKIIIDSENTWIDCFYHVYGERKDVNKLIVEYQGEKTKSPNRDLSI